MTLTIYRRSMGDLIDSHTRTTSVDMARVWKARGAVASEAAQRSAGTLYADRRRQVLGESPVQAAQGDDREWVRRTWFECNQDIYAYTLAVQARATTQPREQATIDLDAMVDRVADALEGCKGEDQAAFAYIRAALNRQAAPEAPTLQHFGWMYIDDDGHGPFFTQSEKNANRYLHNWKAYKVAPADGHVCDYSLGYGKCSQCFALEVAGASTGAAPEAPDSEQQAKCWSCKKPYTLEQRADADGNCPHCGVEIELATPAATTASADKGEKA